MNKESELPNLTRWCANFHEREGIKVHPSSVPLNAVLEDLMGKYMDLIKEFELIRIGFCLLNDEFKKLKAILQKNDKK